MRCRQLRSPRSPRLHLRPRLRPTARSLALSLLGLLGLVGLLVAAPARADEGMWPFDMVPRQRIEQTHRVTLTDAWLDHVRLASVRFNVVDPCKLPDRWLHARKELPGPGPVNFVSTNDIVGGNSGSPVINAAGDLVGLIFDGNLASLPNRFIYDETVARAVSVDTAAMLDALRVVYGADALVAELSPR
jgi:Peptidase S46